MQLDDLSIKLQYQISQTCFMTSGFLEQHFVDLFSFVLRLMDLDHAQDVRLLLLPFLYRVQPLKLSIWITAILDSLS